MPRASRTIRGPGRRRRRSAADRRRQVVQAAKRLVLREGVEALTMRRVARLSGVSASALYLYFPDRQHLMSAVADALFQGLLAAFDAAVAAVGDDADPRARLDALMNAYVQWGLAHPDEYRVIFMTPGAGAAAKDRTGEGVGVTPSGQASFTSLQAEVARLMERGVLRRNDPAIVAEAIWTVGHGLVSLMITRPDFPWRDPERLRLTLAETMRRGLAADQPAR